MFKHLLLPVDLNDMAIVKTAITQARDLAATWDSDLRLLYVLPIVPSTYLEYVPVDFEQGERARVEGELSALIQSFGLNPKRTSFVVRTGGIYHEVLDEAEACKADLIIVGSHWPSFVTYLTGSNATNIVRHAVCSVLVIRG